MWIPQFLGSTNHNLLCKRMMCFLKIRFCETQRTVFNKIGRYSVSNLDSKFWRFPKQIHTSSHVDKYESIEESGDSDELLASIPRNIIVEDYSEQFRNTLYPNSDDLVISKLKSCDSIQEIFTTSRENVQLLNSSHYCQILLVLYDIVQSKNFLANRTFNFPKSIESELPLPLSSFVLNILDSLKDYIQKLTPEELVCCLLYSKRLGVDINHPAAQAILMRINNLLSNQDAELFTVKALSRLTITFDNQSELWVKLFLIKTLPLIYMHFGKYSKMFILELYVSC